MLPIDENTLEALNGSRSGDRLEVFAWYGGRLAYPDPLPVSGWRLEHDGSESKQVQGTLDLTIADPEGVLAPWLFEDPLGVGGAVLQCRYHVGGAGFVDVGWYRITTNSPKESWSSRVIREDGYLEPDSPVPAGYRLVMIPGGSTIPVSAADLTVNLLLDEFLAPEQPQSSSVIGEITRIVGDTMPVTFTDVVDVGVPAGVTYDGSKIDAIQDLAGRAGASLRMGGAGELEVYVKSDTPVWAVTGGADGALINIDRTQDVNNLPNVGVARGSEKFVDGEGHEQTRPLQSVSRITTGPLRAGGPHGNIPVFLDSPLLDTQAKVDAAAQTLITNRINSLTLDLDVTCLPNPALQIGDQVAVTQPVVDGRLVPLMGQVMRRSLRSQGSTVANMAITVRCSYADVQAARQSFSISNNIT